MSETDTRSSSQKLWELAEQLLEQTRSRTITWFEGVDNSTFRVGIAKAVVSVTRWGGGKFDTPTFALVLEDEGQRELARLDVEWEDGSTQFPVFEELFERARDSALGVDETLDRVLAGAKQGQVEAPPPVKARSGYAGGRGATTDDIPF